MHNTTSPHKLNFDALSTKSISWTLLLSQIGICTSGRNCLRVGVSISYFLSVCSKPTMLGLVIFSINCSFKSMGQN